MDSRGSEICKKNDILDESEIFFTLFSNKNKMRIFWFISSRSDSIEYKDTYLSFIPDTL